MTVEEALAAIDRAHNPPKPKQISKGWVVHHVPTLAEMIAQQVLVIENAKSDMQKAKDYAYQTGQGACDRAMERQRRIIDEAQVKLAALRKHRDTRFPALSHYWRCPVTRAQRDAEKAAWQKVTGDRMSAAVDAYHARKALEAEGVDEAVARVMVETGMGPLQAYRHIQQQDRLRQQLRQGVLR